MGQPPLSSSNFGICCGFVVEVILVVVAVVVNVVPVVPPHFHRLPTCLTFRRLTILHLHTTGHFLRTHKSTNTE